MKYFRCSLQNIGRIYAICDTHRRQKIVHESLYTFIMDDYEQINKQFRI